MGKLTIQLNENLDRILGDLAKAENVPKTQIIRRAIAIMQFLEAEKQAGNRIAIADVRNNVIKELVI